MIPSIGGIILILGAIFLYYGNLQYSIIMYFFADICWMIMALLDKDYLGVFLISIGMILGVLVYIKIHTGIFKKSLLK